MSGAALGWAKKACAPSATSKAVLICLADYADADGRAWPCVPKLAKEVQVSDRTVQRALSQLLVAGLVRREKSFRQNGGETSSVYTLTMTPGDSVSPTPGVMVSPAPRHPVTPPVTPVSPAIEEPPLEPEVSDDTSSPAAVVAGSADDTAGDEDQPKTAPALFVAAWSAYPHHLKRSSRKDTLAAWRQLSVTAKANLPKAAKAYETEERKRPKRADDAGPPAMERWIKRELWANWLEEELPAAHAIVFPGPPDLRRAVVSTAGEDFARSWLDPCTWQQQPYPALGPRTRFGADKLEREIGAVLKHFGITIQQEAA